MNVFLGLGSNLGNRIKNLRQAIDRIGHLDFTRVWDISPIYINPAQGQCGGEFFNVVIRVSTLLGPRELLHRLQEIEMSLGRTQKHVYTAREIDIDILLYGNKEIRSPDLIVPHPRMRERDFVMVPLSEIEPGFAAKINGLVRRGVLCRW